MTRTTVILTGLAVGLGMTWGGAESKPAGALSPRTGRGAAIGFSRNDAANAISRPLREAERRLQQTARQLEQERKAGEAGVEREAKTPGAPQGPEGKKEGGEKGNAPPSP